MGTAVALSLAFAATAQADTDVQSLTGDWSASNSTVKKLADGVHFGTYADGGRNGGSLVWHGADGVKLSDVEDFSYTFNYKQTEYGVTTKGAAPYARIFLDTNGDGITDADVLLDPSFCDDEMPAQKVDLTYQMVGNSVRYDDDACEPPAPDQQPWGDIVDAHGGDVITMVAVTQGYSSGTEVSAMLKSITFNGESFNFNAAPADGQDGEDGQDGINGTDGVNGKDGAAGPAGKDGVTTIVHESTTTGARMRTLHVRKIAGMKFMGARASLRGTSVQTIRGRMIKVDLRGKTAGNYRVFITAKYKANGKVYKVRSIRSLNITRS